MSDAHDPDLTPCPFCGGTALEVAQPLADESDWAVICQSCGTMGPDGTREHAERLWNIRHPYTAQGNGKP